MKIITRAIATWLLLIFVFLAPQLAQAKKKQPPPPQPPPPVAKSGPSFEVTRDWLVSALAQYGGTPSYVSCCWYAYSEAAISNSCVLTFHNDEYQTDYKNGSTPMETSTITMPIGAVTNTSLQSYGDSPQLSIQTGNLAAITLTNSFHYNDKLRFPDGSEPSFGILIGRQPQVVPGQPMPDSSADMAKRFQAAFQHMVDICKGTYQAPAQQNQPF